MPGRNSSQERWPWLARSLAVEQMTARRVLLELLAAGVMFLVLEALVFRTGLYPSLLQPKSYAGRSHYTIKILQDHLPASDQVGVLVVGNSRIGEGFSARIADKQLADHSLRFFNAANPGTNSRVWYYLLRELDPHADRYEVVVVPLENYNDMQKDPAGMARVNMSSMLPYIRYSDVLDFFSGFQDQSMRMRALAMTLFKGFGYQKDFQEFIQSPIARWWQAESFRRVRFASAYKYRGRSESVAGIQYDVKRDRFVYPSDSHLSRKMRGVLEEFCRGKQFSFNGREFKRTWLGRIAEHYSQSQVKLVFLRLPRAPFVLFTPQQPQRDSVIRTLASRENLVLLPEAAFNFLESPGYYHDGIHLNRAGREAFSRELARQIAAVLEIE